MQSTIKDKVQRLIWGQPVATRSTMIILIIIFIMTFITNIKSSLINDHPHHHDIDFHLGIEQPNQVCHDHHDDPDHHQVHLVLGRQSQVVVDDARQVRCDITKQNSYNRRGNNEK